MTCIIVTRIEVLALIYRLQLRHAETREEMLSRLCFRKPRDVDDGARLRLGKRNYG